MWVVIVSSEEEANAAEQAAKEKGLQWAATSNTGLPYGKWHLTFLPASAFNNEKETI